MGSIIAVLIVFLVQSVDSQLNRQGILFLLFGFFMAFGAIFSWAYLPDIYRVIDGTTEIKNLEDLGEGRAKARREGEIITIRDKLNEIRRRRNRRRSGTEDQVGGVIGNSV